MAEKYGLFHQPKNTMPKITRIWAALSVDPEDGNEGVCATFVGGAWMPLIAADEERLAIIREQARMLAAQGRAAIRIVKFTGREELETFGLN